MNNTLNEKVKKSIERFKLFEPDEGYWVGYSGGKDSDVIRILADLANVKHDLHHSLTTVDAPETIQYIKSIPNVSIELKRDKDGKQITMWNLIVKNGMPPTRLVRYCCSALKEGGGQGRLKVTGVRWAESVARKNHSGVVMIESKKRTLNKIEAAGVEYEEKKKALILNDDNDSSRRVVEQCFRTDRTILNPIVDWTDEEVWEFLHHYGCESNPLYHCGRHRIGCIGCPMAGGKGQKEAFERYPIYRANYIRAFNQMLEKRKADGKETNTAWTDGEAVMAWWVGDLKVKRK